MDRSWLLDEATEGHLRWFGPTWHAQVCDPRYKSATPLAEFCQGCEDQVADGDRGLILLASPDIPHSFQWWFDSAEHSVCCWHEVKAAAAVIGASGDDIEPDGGILGGAIAHVLNGYGKMSAKAVRVEGGAAEPETWSTDAQAAIRRERGPLNPETGEFDPDQLKQALDAPEESEDE